MNTKDKNRQTKEAPGGEGGAARETIRESSRETIRESSRGAIRESSREAARELPREAPREESREAARDESREEFPRAGASRADGADEEPAAAVTIFVPRQPAELELVAAKEALERKAGELAEALSLSRATLESTGDGILVTNDRRAVTGWNENYRRMWRLPGELLEHRDHAAILEFSGRAVADPAAFIARANEIHASQLPETRDEIQLLDGRIFERYTRQQTIDSRIVGRVWSFRDITARRRAEEEHAHLAAIVASSSDAIVSKTLDGIITSWNAAAERSFGYTAEEAVGQSISLIIPPDRMEEEREIVDRIRRGERIEHLHTMRLRKDGRLLPVSLTISPVLDAGGTIIGASKIARDVSEREALLARERAARTRAEEASRLKDEFVATVSHELRTPLHAILGWTQVLATGTLDAEKTRHAIEVIERNARAQAQVIEDLLDVSRVMSGKLRLNVQPIMPAVPIEAALESVRPMAEARGVRLDALLDAQAGPVTGDTGRLQQVVWNLLTNAIKFTGRGGRVEVRLERVNSHVEIGVSDTGEGIAPEFLPHVFDRFRQADATASRHAGGLGLGLAIVRHLVELHGGAVRADSPGPGRGATFTVRLPLRAVHARREGAADVHPAAPARPGRPVFENAPDLTGVRVLVVDDEADTRDLLTQVLEECGAEVRGSSSAATAMEELARWQPAIIVSDIGMPGEDGYSFIRRVRDVERRTGRWTPAVALTAYARAEDRMRALLAGYQVHVAKPIEPMEFVLVVAGAVRPHSP